MDILIGRSPGPLELEGGSGGADLGLDIYEEEFLEREWSLDLDVCEGTRGQMWVLVLLAV